MKKLLYVFFLILSVQLNAQHAYYSDEVKAKMNQNKIDGLPLTSGLEFIYTIVPNSEYTQFYPKDDNSLLVSSLNIIKFDLSLNKYVIINENNSGLIIKIYSDNEILMDAIKWSFYNKNLKPLSIMPEVLLKN
jgi:hypothetical protein